MFITVKQILEDFYRKLLTHIFGCGIMTSMKTTTLNVQLPVSLDELMQREAQRRMTSKSAIVREALSDYAKRLQSEETVRRGMEHIDRAFSEKSS